MPPQLAADALHRRAAPRAAALATAARSPGPSRSRVLVAMSGGVDSAVAALLERERGAEVVARHAEALGRPARPTAQGLLLAGGGARRRVAGALARHPAPDARPRGGVPPPGRRPSSSTATPPAGPRTRASLCNGEVRIAAMIDLAERLGATAPRHRPLRAHRRRRRGPAARRRRRRRQGPELHARRAAAGAARRGCASRSPS